MNASFESGDLKNCSMSANTCNLNIVVKLKLAGLAVCAVFATTTLILILSNRRLRIKAAQHLPFQPGAGRSSGSCHIYGLRYQVAYVRTTGQCSYGGGSSIMFSDYFILVYGILTYLELLLLQLSVTLGRRYFIIHSIPTPIIPL